MDKIIKSRTIFNIKTIRAMKFDTIDLGPFSAYFGHPESKFTCMCYGPSGSGKSVFALQMADYMAKHFGKVLYNSHEERVNQTIRDRIINFNIDAERLYVAKGIKFDEMVDKIQRNYYRTVVIDSVQYMDFTYDQFRELRARFIKRKLSVIMVSFGTSLKNTDGAKDLLHASDIKLHFHSGMLTAESRYSSKIVKQKLFGAAQQGQLF